jgi:hypothetical protein
MLFLLLLYQVFVPLVIQPPAAQLESGTQVITDGQGMTCEWLARADVCQLEDPAPIQAQSVTLHRGAAIVYTQSMYFCYEPAELLMIRHKISTYEEGHLFLVYEDQMAVYTKESQDGY